MLCYVGLRDPAIGTSTVVPDGFPKVSGKCCRFNCCTDTKPFALPGRLKEVKGVGCGLHGLVVISDCRPSRRHQPPGHILRLLGFFDPAQWAAPSDKGVALRRACGIHSPCPRRPIRHGPRTGCRRGAVPHGRARRVQLRRARGSARHVGGKARHPAGRPRHRQRSGRATGGRRESRCRR